MHTLVSLAAIILFAVVVDAAYFLKAKAEIPGISLFTAAWTLSKDCAGM